MYWKIGLLSAFQWSIVKALGTALCEPMSAFCALLSKRLKRVEPSANFALPSGHERGRGENTALYFSGLNDEQRYKQLPLLFIGPDSRCACFKPSLYGGCWLFA